MVKKNWFNPKGNLGGWHKNQSIETRRANVINARNKTMTLYNRRLSAGRALIALANVTQDSATRLAATADAHYFFKLAKGGK